MFVVYFRENRVLCLELTMVLLSSKQETSVRSPFGGVNFVDQPQASSLSMSVSRRTLATLAGHYCVSLGAGPLWCS